MSSFKDFMKQRQSAAQAFCSGDPDPVDALSTDCDPATFFAPDGRVTKGASAIKQGNREGARSFGRSGESSFEILQLAASGDLAFWTGIQHAKIETGGRLMTMDLRVTELFRREEGEWKLVHRHADMPEKR